MCVKLRASDLLTPPRCPHLCTSRTMSTPANKIRTRLTAALLGMVGLFVGVGLFTFWYGQGYSYLSNDPRACTNCHIMREQFDGWQKAAHHANATCNDCHTPKNIFLKYLSKADNGFWHSKGFTFQDFHEPIMIKPRNSAILQANCVRCHGELVSDINHHAGDKANMLDCVHCHREVGHGPVR